MSAPRTNLDRQKRRHIPALIGIAVTALFGVLVIVYWLFEEAAQSDPPPAADEVEAPATAIPPQTVAPGPADDPDGSGEPFPAPQDNIAPDGTTQTP
jgi:hypothetical protein